MSVVPRVIPCLSVQGQSLVKTVRFSKPKYLGDPINTVRLFNEMEADELIIADITASIEDRPPNLSYVKEIVSECFMPVCYAGGVRTIDDMRALFSLGIEKVAVNTAAALNPDIISQAAEVFGSQSVIVSIDVRRSLFGKSYACIRSGTEKVRENLLSYVKKCEAMGAGEILLNSIDRDGTMIGYDVDLIRAISTQVTIPLIACGGASKVADLRAAIFEGHASAAAAGSIFVFQGPLKGVLINYPSRRDLEILFSNESSQ